MHRLLAHIFDNSACLTKRQLKDYVTGVMAEEECYAVERHANDCSFCSEAIDGLSAHNGEAVSLLETTLTPEFLHDHFQKNLPPVHLNSIGPTAAAESAPAKHKKSGIGWLHISALAATLLLSFFLIRGWKPQHRPPDRHVALPATVADTMPVVAQKQKKEESRKKSTALPPAEKSEGGTASAPEIPANTLIPAEALRDAKPVETIQEPNKPADNPTRNETAPPDNKAVQEEHITTTAPEKDNTNHRQLADEAFDRAHYTKALGHYRQVLNNNAATREDKDAAGIMAARCYILLGSKAQAITLLREIADGNSPQSGEAGKLLAELN